MQKRRRRRKRGRGKRIFTRCTVFEFDHSPIAEIVEDWGLDIPASPASDETNVI